MKRRVLQVLLALVGVIMFVRFGGPALIFGATGPGPMGERWLEAGQSATLLMDNDLRFFGALLLGLGVLFFWMIPTVERHGGVIRILAAATFAGAIARVVGFAAFGTPEMPAIVATAVEFVLPVLIIPLQIMVAREDRSKAEA